MSKRSFYPRYLWAGGPDYFDTYVTGVYGIWAEDFDAILKLATASLTKKWPGEATGVSEYLRELEETVGHMRKRSFLSKGQRGIRFDTKWEDPLSFHRVDQVLTSASLYWMDTVDPDHHILSRLPSNYIFSRLEGYDPVTPDQARLYHTFSLLKDRSDEKRMAWCRPWRGADKGSFARVVDMTPDQKAKRIEAMRERQKTDAWIKSLFQKKVAT